MVLTPRAELLAIKRAELQDRLSRINRDLQRAEGALPADSGERALTLENDEVLEQLEASTKEELAQVIHAIHHLAAGHADTCESCGHPIETARLDAVVHATRCRTCSGLGPAKRARRAAKPAMAVHRPSSAPAT